mgnify:CR=1 FL=1|tara:strand:- start:260 stop:565 length:306 start_codon:yes stop_codon:yes gene_type:complete
MKRIQEVIKIEESDRIMFISYNDKGEVNGLNFCQGLNDDEGFFKSFYCNDMRLTEFYHIAKDYVIKESTDTRFPTIELYSLLDNICWMYLELKINGVIEST